MTDTERPLRADARRNREKIMTSAGELFARLGTEAQMDEIAEHCGLGLGTLYRHFPTKEALLAAIVSERFERLAQLAREAEQIADPGEAFEALLRRYLEAADGDAAFQLALLSSDRRGSSADAGLKAELHATITRIIDRAITAKAIRADFTFADFPVITCGVMSTMYFKPGGNSNWRRHLQLILDSIHTQP